MTVPCQSIDLFVLNLVLHWVRYEHSIALVAEKKSNHIMYAIPQELVTLVSHRGIDKYFLLQYPIIAAKYLFSCIYLRYACWTYWCLCGNEPKKMKLNPKSILIVLNSLFHVYE